MHAKNQPDEADARLARLIARQAEKRHLALCWAERAGIGPGMTVLDLGAGTCALAIEYAAMVVPGGEVIALDPDPASLGHGSTEAARRGLPLRTMRGRAEGLPTLPRAPSIVMMSDTLHHIVDKAGALGAIRAAMVPGSHLFIAEYDPAGPGTHGAPHAQRLSPEETTRLLAETGFHAEPAAPGPDEHYTIIATP